MLKLGRVFFVIPAPFLTLAAIIMFGFIADPPNGPKTRTIECLSVVKGDAVEGEPGKFEYTCELWKE